VVESRAVNLDGWTDWQPLALAPAPDAAVLAETIDGGQAFRWQREADEIWLGQWDRHVARLRVGASGQLEWTAAAADTELALRTYLDADRDARELADTLPWRSDAHLARCIAAFPGLRILRQPFGETLLGFLCSATKQIVQIKQMMALLATRHGARMYAEGATKGKDARGNAQTSQRPVPTWHRLPTWTEIAAVPEAELRGCLLGFRARYIHQTAQFIAAHPGWLEETEALPYAEAKARLVTLPGVGEKVADCVLLFGAGRLEAFPVDVWILKTMAARYGLEGWKPAQVAQFGRAHFGPLAGLAQQYLFAWERAEARRGA
jgi:N-glycosylase/DNA lyase